MYLTTNVDDMSSVKNHYYTIVVQDKNLTHVCWVFKHYLGHS